MNEIKVTVELCGEDRARLDTIIEKLSALGNRPDCSQCVKDVAGLMDKACDAIDKKAAQEAPKNAQEEPKASDHPALDPFPATSTAAEEPGEEKEKPTVSTAELQQLVIALCRAGKKDKVREVISAYGAQTVATIPEDKLADVYTTLKKLEG